MTHHEAHHQHMEEHHLAPMPVKKARHTLAAAMLEQAHAAKQMALDTGKGQLTHCVTSFMTALSPIDAIKAMDTDGDGKVDAAELAAATGVTLEDATTIIEAADQDGDGKVDAAELDLDLPV